LNVPARNGCEPDNAFERQRIPVPGDPAMDYLEICRSLESKRVPNGDLPPKRVSCWAFFDRASPFVVVLFPVSNNPLEVNLEKDIINELNGVLAEAGWLEEFPPKSGRVADPAGFHKFRSGRLQVLQRAFGKDHDFYESFKAAVLIDGPWMVHVNIGRAILEKAQEEIDRGWLRKTLPGLISAELFSDYLEMAEYLLSENFKDAAAVIIGSTLEGHLRRLAKARNIPLTSSGKKGSRQPKKAEIINQDLHKADAYDLTEQKQITAWLGRRNDAAHGDYGKYTADQVRHMLEGVRNFIAHVPA